MSKKHKNNSSNEIYIAFIDYGPFKNDIHLRNKNRICTSIRFNEYGETEFFCNNDASPFIVTLIPLSQPAKIWIDEAMICDECLDNLKNKYHIDFKNEIPRWYLSKGTDEYASAIYEELPLIKNLNEWYDGNNMEKKLNDFYDTEIRWFRDKHFLYGVPFSWLTNFKLDSCTLKGSSSQGNFNGPDYIFRDTRNNKLIGFEITSYKWNFLPKFKNIETIKKFAKEHIFNTYSFDQRINEMKDIIKNKSNKKYIQTDELYLGIVVNNTLVDYEYYVLEIILNKWIKEENIKLDGVYIL